VTGGTGLVDKTLWLGDASPESATFAGGIAVFVFTIQVTDFIPTIFG
jgi:hypothetical protein